MVKQMIWKKTSPTASYMFTIDNWFHLVKMLISVTLTIIVINAENAWESCYGRLQVHCRDPNSWVYSSHTLIVIQVISDLKESLHASLKYMYCIFLVAMKEYK